MATSLDMVVSTGRRLRYELHGPADADAPAVLLIDGTGSSLAEGSGRRDAARLSAHFRVIIYDHRG